MEVPYANEIIPQRSNGRVEVKVSTWSEMNLTGNEIIRLTRQGQVEIGGAPLTYVAGDVPLLDAADLKGRKIRTFGTSLNDLVTALGAQPVSITFAEVYTSLERGVADCGITGTGSGNAAKCGDLYNEALAPTTGVTYVVR